ncbi:MAG: YhcH/YjgK/YiaL family protein [Opitutaceae bacterium]|nr:YhcH/YjgK/YiaL family protein [Opitutaceae bacterium]
MAFVGRLASLLPAIPFTLASESVRAYLLDAERKGGDAYTRISALAPGVEVRVELPGGAFALEQAYVGKSRDVGRFESHRKYIDLQLIVAGREFMDIADVGTLVLDEDLTPARDVIFYRAPEAYSILRMHQGDIAVFLPPDGHRPSLAIEPGEVVWKTVVKVPVLQT